MPDTLPAVYEWLLADIVKRLSPSPKGLRVTEDGRTHETYTVSIRFEWTMGETVPDFDSIHPRELLELSPDPSIYPYHNV